MLDLAFDKFMKCSPKDPTVKDLLYNLGLDFERKRMHNKAVAVYEHIARAGKDWFGHGGAHATNMEIHTGKGLVTVWMVQHGGYPGQGGKAHGVFKNWAYEKYGK